MSKWGKNKKQENPMTYDSWYFEIILWHLLSRTHWKMFVYMLTLLLFFGATEWKYVYEGVYLSESRFWWF